MKFTFVFDGLQFGGIERVGVEYIKLLKKKGYYVSIINLRPRLRAMEKELPDKTDIRYITFSRNIVPERYSKLERMGRAGKIAFRICKSIMTVIQKIYKLCYISKLPDSDVIIAFSGHYNDLTFVAENFDAGKKIAWLHGNQASYDNIAPGYFRLYRKIKNLICLSEKEDEQIIQFNKENGIYKKKIYNPINLTERYVDEKKVRELKQQYGDYILMVGRMEKDKDQETLIRAVIFLKNKYKICKNLVLVGDGSNRAYLEKIVKNEKMEHQIYFVGARYDVENYYRSATVYAHSSPAEGLPTVLLEAMYYRLPIASTDSEPGVREILQEKCGLITPIGNSQELAESIYKLYTDEVLVDCLRENCQSRIKDFLAENVIEQFEEYVQNIKMK